MNISDLPVPISRSDIYKYAIITEQINNLPAPVSREDYYLKALIDGSIEDISYPVSRGDKYKYNTIMGSMDSLEEPISRSDFYWYAICSGYINNLPQPVSRGDFFDYYLATHSAFREWLEVSGFDIFVGNSRAGMCKDVRIKGRTFQNLFTPLGRIMNANTYAYQQITNLEMYKINSTYTLIALNYGNAVTISLGTSGANNPYFNKVDISKPVKFIYDKINNPMYVFLYPNTNGQLIDIDNARFMILEGDYTNNPNLPDYINGIESVGEKEGTVVIESKGKNLFDGDKIKAFYSQEGVLNYQTNIDTWCFICKVCKNKTYTISKKGGNRFNIACTVEYPKIGDRLFVVHTQDIDDATKTVDVANYNYLVVYVTNNGNADSILMQIENGTQQTPYQPYQSDTETILLSEPLRSLPNGVCDEIVDGRVIRRVGKVVFDGSEKDWACEDNPGYLRWIKPLYNSKKESTRRPITSDKFTTEYTQSLQLKGIGFTFGERIYLYPNSSITVLSEWLNWLKINPTTVYYELETPTTEQLPLIYLKSYTGGTYISTTNNIKGEVTATVPVK